jgi:DNA-binding transcriptional MerR regulator
VVIAGNVAADVAEDVAGDREEDVARDLTVAEWPIDELARRSGVPARTIREYQTLQLLAPPRRRGRVGVYDERHLARLRLIGRLQQRGYSLAGIRDLLEAWAEGDDLAGVLGDDELPMPDESALVVARDDVPPWLEPLGAHERRALEDLGLIRALDRDRVCLPAPSLVRLVVDATTHGVDPDDAIALVAAVTRGVRAIADELASSTRAALADEVDPEVAARLVQRGRALLSQGTARLLVQELADALAATAPAGDADHFARLVDAARISRNRDCT